VIPIGRVSALRGGRTPRGANKELKRGGLERAALPADLRVGLDAGKLSLEQLRNYVAIRKSLLLRALASLGPFLRNRLIANPQLAGVILIETALGVATMLIAEANARGDQLVAEIDFVLCDLALVVATNIALVITLSPAVALGPPPAGLAKALARLPSSFLQAGAYSPAQRLGCFLANAVQFGGIGVLSSTIGASATKGLVCLRQQLTGKRPDVQLAPIVSTALAYGSFVALSSSTRYQLVNAIEASILPVLPFPTGPLSAALRASNNFLGGVSWIWWARLLGVQ
jgi:hypothetical protein